MLKTALIAALGAGALTAAAPADPQPGGPPPDGRLASRSAWVKVISCSRADQSAVFYARVRRLQRGQRMSVRFKLLERGADGRYAPVDAPGLNRWRRSKPGVRAFGYRQRVRGLAPGSAYRARVEYRWHGADGALDRRVFRRSGVCNQATPLPNLRARVAAVWPGASPGSRRYTVRLANAGRVGARNAGVRLAVEGASSETKTVWRVPARGAVYVDFDAPRCVTGVLADADPAGAHAESNEADNGRRLACSELPG